MRKIEKTCFVLGILCCICSTFFITHGIETHKEYEIIKDDLVEISATVSKIVVNKDVDGANTYTVRVTYNYESNQYKDRVWKDVSKKSEYRVGEEVQITINPAEPNSPYNYEGDWWIWPLAMLFFLGVGIGFIIMSFKINV